MIVVSLLMGFVEVALLTMVGGLVDRLAAAADPHTFFEENAAFLWTLAALIVFARPLTMVAQGALTSLVVNPGLPPRVIWGLHRHSLSQSIRFFEDDFAGRLAQKQMQTGAAVSSVTVDVVNAFGLIISFVLGMAAALAAVDWRLAALTLAWAALYALALRVTLPAVRAAARRRAEARSAVSGQLVDSFTNIRTVKLFAHAGREEAAAERALRRYSEAARRFGRAVLTLRLALAALSALLMGGLTAFSLALWAQGDASVGVVAAAGILAFRATAMSGWIAFTALGVFSEIGAAEDGLASLAKPHGLTDAPKASGFPTASHGPVGRQAPLSPPAIAFEQVSFDYGALGGRRPADLIAPAKAGVADVSLQVRAGEKVALVGPSGAGKSTLIALLLRLYDPQAGCVRVDGVDVRDVTQDALRRRIGVITQETALFNRSALDNIRYGRPEATEAEAIEAARLARADGFIRDLRDGAGRRGYAAHLGERGVKLSGGQRQRIALARVLLKDAPILVLDEATSALDSATEQAILDAVERRIDGKTVIAIAHRLSTIAHMDRIVVVSDGGVVEQGHHQALLSQGGLYARLWRSQSGGYLGGSGATASTMEAAE